MIENIRIHYKKDFRGVGRQLPKALEKASSAVGDKWWRAMLPDHFRTRAFSKYGYQRRGEKYMARKQKEKGHKRPLELTGALKNALLSGAKIVGTQRQATIKLTGPRWLKGWIAMKGRKRKDGKPTKYPDKEREIKTITDTERVELTVVHKRRLVTELRNIRAVRTTTL